MTARRIFWPALIVAVCAAVATAHGLYEVAVASRVPWPIAWLYPVITDGLALVAYAATRQLSGPTARGYAWTVVVIAAGLSGLAQAVLLATDPATATPLFVDGEQLSILTAPTAVRFGIGAWPAIAAAVVAHLLYLLAHDDAEETSGELVTETDVPAVPVVDLELTDTDPHGWWPAAEEVGGDESSTAGLVAVPDLDEPPTLEQRVDAVIAEYVRQGRKPPGRRTIANELGLDSDYPVRTILEARS